MGAYIPVIIWVISAIICYFIARKRGVEHSLFRDLVVAFLGPFAIPLFVLAKPADRVPVART